MQQNIWSNIILWNVCSSVSVWVSVCISWVFVCAVVHVPGCSDALVEHILISHRWRTVSPFINSLAVVEYRKRLSHLLLGQSGNASVCLYVKLKWLQWAQGPPPWYLPVRSTQSTSDRVTKPERPSYQHCLLSPCTCPLIHHRIKDCGFKQVKLWMDGNFHLAPSPRWRQWVRYGYLFTISI